MEPEGLVLDPSLTDRGPAASHAGKLLAHSNVRLALHPTPRAYQTQLIQRSKQLSSNAQTYGPPKGSTPEHARKAAMFSTRDLPAQQPADFF